MATLTNEYILKKLNNTFPDSVQEVDEPHKLLTFTIAKSDLLDLIAFLKEDKELQFGFLTDLTAVHYPKKDLPLVVVYHLHSLVNNVRIRIKVGLPLYNPSLPTLCSLYKGANWMERETYDFFGVIFEGHPDLRRILNVDDMVAFPMRKEFPLEDPNRRDKNDDYFGR